jgi:hypothetical protein
MENKNSKFASLKPFFAVIEQGLSGLVDGDHYFDYWQLAARTICPRGRTVACPVLKTAL